MAQKIELDKKEYESMFCEAKEDQTTKKERAEGLDAIYAHEEEKLNDWKAARSVESLERGEEQSERPCLLLKAKR